MPTINDLASQLAEEHAQNLKFHPIELRPSGHIECAYSIQDELVSIWMKNNGTEIVGWKIGLTSKRMQEMCGIDSPAAGAILGDRVLLSGSDVHHADYVRLGIEMELAVRVGAAIGTTPHVTRKNVRSVLDGAASAFELIEDRDADYSKLDAFSLIADNSWNAGILLGNIVPFHDFGTTLGRRGILLCGDKEVDRGLTEDAGGDPLDVVVWLAQMLNKRGRRLEPGQWIMTGSLIPTQFPKAGERYQFTIDGLPPVELNVV